MQVNSLAIRALTLNLVLLFTPITWAEESAPSMAFLEFLADLDNEEGAWLDQQRENIPKEQESNETESIQREVQDNE